MPEGRGEAPAGGSLEPPGGRPRQVVNRREEAQPWEPLLLLLLMLFREKGA